MEELSRQQLDAAFRKELRDLREEQYITRDEYRRLTEAHNRHVKNQQVASEPAIKQETVSQEKAPDESQLQPKTKLVKEHKPKKVRTKEQVRERNITWSLILGVVLLLISGLVVATSQWDQMSSVMKVFSISFVSLFFLGLSLISRKYLRIEQTAFAFLTLGSMLVPIVILAIGYFELLGNYLSLYGEGRYILGLIGQRFRSHYILEMPICTVPAYSYGFHLFPSRLQLGLV
ncbi:hypothetical protein MUO14_13965 [Halobacillus shinanisalinarum]|uniref:Uncharacterized protein n=1 Tax=Halobacillus shinanisalinarum TaxID=2932258 RepID=A0ABY4GUN0_9BACI|nr:hypothetical protein [Halobacillus shinanisalinarum]UOQ91656.1 hypothetical protein MUO14_13965 [Halobacillus shinanisalinarum]